jgi:hypothetical protein
VAVLEVEFSYRLFTPLVRGVCVCKRQFQFLGLELIERWNEIAESKERWINVDNSPLSEPYDDMPTFTPDPPRPITSRDW